MGDNNKLWLAVVVAVLLISFAVLLQARRQGSAKNEVVGSPPAQRPGVFYGDAKHAQFVERLLKEKSVVGKVTAARFAPADNPDDGDILIVVVRPDTSADDVEYISMIAARKNKVTFHTRIKVVVYRTDSVSRTDTLVATTRWVDDDYGFVTKFAPTGE